MRTYAMSYREVMSLPMRVFWEFSGLVDRLRADEQRMQLQVGVALNNEDSIDRFNKYLDKVAPGPYRLSSSLAIEPELDEEGLEELRALSF